jgi:hypothetical protein
LLGDDEEKIDFNAPAGGGTTAFKRNDLPIVENALFGGSDLKGNAADE